MPINVLGNSNSNNSGNKNDTSSFVQRFYRRINYIEVKETTQKIGNVIKETQPEKPQLASESTPNHQPKENSEGVVYDVELEITLKNMTDNSRFVSTYYDPKHGWMWNGYLIQISFGTEVEIKDKKFNITPGILKVLTDTSNIPQKKLNDKDGEIFNKNLESLGFENHKAKRGEPKSGRYKQSKTNFKKHKFTGQGIEKKSYHQTLLISTQDLK